MTPDAIIKRVKRLFTGPSKQQATGKRAASAREHRHETVVALHQDVRKLQQQIVELSDREGIDPADVEAREESPEMAALHRELTAKQHELARYQARV